MGVILGVVINVVGYSLGRAFIYSTPEYSLLKLPFQIFQAAFGSVYITLTGSLDLLCFPATKLIFEKYSFIPLIVFVYAVFVLFPARALSA